MKKLKTQKLNTNKGITLIALVITIIVMLILVAVTIAMAVNGGLFEYAGNAGAQTNAAIANEQELGSGKVTIGNTVYNSIDEYLGTSGGSGGTEIEPPKQDIENYVGCYADINDDGTPDGIIYADLAVGNTNERIWLDYGEYSIPVETGLKEYYVSQTDYVGTFGTEPRDVIRAVGGEGKDRFYVMALQDASNGTASWYSNAEGKMSDYETATSGDFGTGKANTEKIKKYWDKNEESPYGAQTSTDLWALIDSNSDRTWFLPSRGEWAAFVQELGIVNSSYYNTYGLRTRYWSSSQDGTDYAWLVDFNGGDMWSDFVYMSGDCGVRLSATF